MSEERVERRLAAIVAVDVAGYSRLMGRDEEGTLAALRAIRRDLSDPKIKEHQGRIVKTMGDGLLIEFASVVGAVRCSVDLQRAMAARNAEMPSDKRIEFRIGIHQGDIIVEDGDIFGDGVNLAARLEGLAEPGGICISRVVRDEVRDKLDLAFDDLGEQQMKNIARPVHVFRVALPRLTSAALGTLSRDAPHPPAARVPPSPRERGEGRGEGQQPALALPDKPSLVVLPFQNMSGDPEQEYFADGMVEEITTAIARLPWLFVIARNSAFTYKGRAVDVKQVAQELGVRYVLEGSVRKAGSRVRITGQLIDTATSAHIWADRFDGALDDVFDLQDQVAASVAGAIEPKLRQSEIERASRKPTERLDAYDLYLRALAQFHLYTDKGFAETLALIERVLAIDPSYASAAALVGQCRIFQGVQGWGAFSETDVSAAVRLARQALEAERDDAETVAQAAFTLFYFAGETALAMAALDRALALNPSSAFVWGAKASIHALRNQPEPAIEAANRALRLSPFDPLGFWLAVVPAIAHLLAGRFEQAIEWADRALQIQPRYLPARRYKIAANAHLGRLAEARAELGELLAIFPGSTITRTRANSARAASAEFLDVVAAGLRLAGLPEG